MDFDTEGLSEAGFVQTGSFQKVCVRGCKRQAFGSAVDILGSAG